MNRKLFSKASVILEIAGYVFCVAAVVVAIVGFFTLDELPEHYDLHGNVTRYGSPAILFLSPLSMLFANGLISVVAHFVNPKVWNMPFRAKPGREIALWRDTVLMQMIMEAIFGVFAFAFTFLEYKAMGNAMLPLGIFMIIVLLVDLVVMTVLMKWHNR